MSDSIRKTKSKKDNTLSPKAVVRAHKILNSNVRVKLGLQGKISDDKVKYILGRLATGNPKTWKALKITSADFDKFGVKGYNK